MVAAAAALAVPAVWASPAAAASRPKNVPKNSIEVTVKKVVDANAIDVVTAKGRTVRIGLLEAGNAPSCSGRCVRPGRE